MDGGGWNDTIKSADDEDYFASERSSHEDAGISSSSLGNDIGTSDFYTEYKRRKKREKHRSKSLPIPETSALLTSNRFAGAAATPSTTSSGGHRHQLRRRGPKYYSAVLTEKRRKRKLKEKLQKLIY